MNITDQQNPGQRVVVLRTSTRNFAPIPVYIFQPPVFYYNFPALQAIVRSVNSFSKTLETQNKQWVAEREKERLKEEQKEEQTKKQYRFVIDKIDDGWVLKRVEEGSLVGTIEGFIWGHQVIGQDYFNVVKTLTSSLGEDRDVMLLLKKELTFVDGHYEEVLKIVREDVSLLTTDNLN